MTLNSDTPLVSHQMVRWGASSGAGMPPGVASRIWIPLCWGQAAGRGSQACTARPSTGTRARMEARRVMRAVREPSRSIRASMASRSVWSACSGRRPGASRG